jgi:hypothetical protein
MCDVTMCGWRGLLRTIVNLAPGKAGPLALAALWLGAGAAVAMQARAQAHS